MRFGGNPSECHARRRGFHMSFSGLWKHGDGTVVRRRGRRWNTGGDSFDSLREAVDDHVKPTAIDRLRGAIDG